MKIKLKSTFIVFLAIFLCVGVGGLYAKQDKTLGEKVDETIDKAKETTKNIKDKSKEFVNDSKDKAAEIAKKTKEKTRELHDKAKEKAHEGIDHL